MIKLTFRKNRKKVELKESTYRELYYSLNKCLEIDELIDETEEIESLEEFNYSYVLELSNRDNDEADFAVELYYNSFKEKLSDSLYKKFVEWILEDNGYSKYELIEE